MRKYLSVLAVVVLLGITTTVTAATKSTRSETSNYVSIETDNKIQSIENSSNVYVKCDVKKVYYFKGKKAGQHPDRIISLDMYVESDKPIYVRALQLDTGKKAQRPITIKYYNPVPIDMEMTGTGKVYYIFALLPNSGFEAMALSNFDLKGILKNSKNYSICFELMDTSGKNTKGKYFIDENLARDISYVIKHDIYSDPDWVNKIPTFY